MHLSSRLKVESFIKHYGPKLPQQSGLSKVLEVGSKSYSAQDTYKPLFASSAFSYTGLDLEDGPNVDLVPAKAYVWDEVQDESFDLCVSGQTFEHNPFFWVTFAEMSRVLSPGGYLIIVAPGAGKIHRFPYDCWRFYPDSWQALCSLTGMTLVESYFESDRSAHNVAGGSWRDSAVIAQKPILEADGKAQFYSRLAAIVAPLHERQIDVPTAKEEMGPCFADYEAIVQTRHRRSLMKSIKQRMQGRGAPVRLHHGAAYHGG